MLNILSVRCGLSYVPYLADALAGYLSAGRFNSRVVRQGGNGLILHSDAEIRLRYQAREAAFGPKEAQHYRATVAFRRDFYDVVRMADEVILANVGRWLLLSHPQSELWLAADAAAALSRAHASGAASPKDADRLPDWLNVSTGAGRLLLSDQRTGRWVLLGADHVAELERRAALLAAGNEAAAPVKTPRMMVKGVTVHLQSAFRLAAALERFSEAGEVVAFKEQAPGYELAIERTAEGVVLRDFDQRVTLTARDARKYAAILREELERRHAAQFERGGLRTVVADDAGGRWVLQWGDEVLVTDDGLAALRQDGSAATYGGLAVRRDGEFILLLEPVTGSCVALAGPEVEALQR